MGPGLWNNYIMYFCCEHFQKTWVPLKNTLVPFSYTFNISRISISLDHADFNDDVWKLSQNGMEKLGGWDLRLRWSKIVSATS